MSEPMAAFYFLQLLRGVEFMHDNGFCHRDLKAENCMVVKKTQKLKIIDFGLARSLESAVTSTYTSQNLHLPFKSDFQDGYSRLLGTRASSDIKERSAQH